MSEMINNREFRQKILKEIITELHRGKSVEEVKPRFENLIKGISTKEITEMEQALVAEGMPVEEIKNLCDVHAAVFKGSIEEIHREQKPEETPGHPVHTMKLENEELANLLNNRVIPHANSFKSSGDQKVKIELLGDLNLLSEIDIHYSKKENLLFPYLEKYNITAPPKVMWGVDDDIRDEIKKVISLIKDESDNKMVAHRIIELANKINEMIYKEESILIPMALETLSEDEWERIANDSDEIGYSYITPDKSWKPVNKNVEQEIKAKGEKTVDEGYVEFDTGFMTPEEINALLNTLPVDITFVGKDDTVKYFDQGKDRIFARPKSVIGRNVENCHPPASVHIVEKIVDDFKSGKKDHEDFWIKMGEKFVYIRYFAVRNTQGEYLGTMEVTQDIKPIQDITGEKRLLGDNKDE